MSQCFRTISSKLPPFVGTRKQVTQLDRQLPKHIKSSTFLEEFFGTQNGLNPTVTLRNSSNKNFSLYISFTNQSVSSLDVPKENPKSLGQNDQKEGKFRKSKEFKELQRFHMPLSVVEPIDSTLEANWRNSRQKTYTRKQHRDIQEVTLKTSPFTIKGHFNQMIPPSIENTTMVLIDGALNLQTENKKDVSPGIGGRPTPEQLEYVYNNLKSELPFLFVRVMDYNIYHPNIVFVNNIRGITTVGIFNYVKQISLLRVIAHLRFMYVSFDILKITMHPEDDTVKVRWRIRGVPGIKILVTFWKFKFWKISEALKEHETWYDGFSIFYVGSDGKIYKHVADKMMPDQDSLLPKEKSEIAAKLVLFLGIDDLKQIFPNASSAFSNLSNFFLQSGQKEKCLEKAMLKMK